MIISQCHAPFPLWVKDRPEFNDYMIMAMEKICAVCEFIGCPAIVAHNITRSTKEKEWDTNMEMYGRMAPAAKKHGVESGVSEVFEGFQPKQFFVSLALTIIYFVMMKYLGFFVSTTAFMLVTLMYLRVPMLHTAIAIVAVDVLIYLAFVEFLGVRLPKGLLF